MLRAGINESYKEKIKAQQETEDWRGGIEAVLDNLIFRLVLGCFVCVYDQNYALVIVTQPKEEEFPIQLAKISQCSFLIQIYKTIFFWN